MPPFSGHFTTADAFVDEQPQAHKIPLHEQEQRQRCVAFGTAQIHEINHWSESELDDLWLNENDYKTNKRDCTKIATLFHMGRAKEDENMCKRGVEKMNRATQLQCKSRKRYSMKVVMEEQERQREEGVIDMDAIANLYKEATNRCAAAAHAVGKQDAEQIL